MSSPRILITGGGTAGHVLPAIAVADALVHRGYRKEEIGFVGSARGMEGRLVPQAGYAISLLPGRGLVRRITPTNVEAMLGLVHAVLRATLLVARHRPRVIVSVGGYASVPLSLAGALLRVPIVIVNVDAVAGLANRLVGHFATASCVAFAGTGLPHEVVTGAPVRTTILATDRSVSARRSARQALGVGNTQRLLVVMGGSLGARSINAAALDVAARHRDDEALVIIHLVGDRNYAEVVKRSESLSLGDRYRPLAYSDEMPMLYSAADLIVGRAGAMSVAELSAVGVPAILVPLPHAPNDHQRRNAQALVDAGSAVLIEDGQLDGPRLDEAISRLFDVPLQLQMMEERAASLEGHGGAEAIAVVIAEVIANVGLGGAPAGR